MKFLKTGKKKVDRAEGSGKIWTYGWRSFRLSSNKA
jgi:hypothetical protein